MFKQIQDKDISTSLNMVVYSVSIVLAGLALPLLLIPLIKFIGYFYPASNLFWCGAEIIEEIAKALIVLFLILALPSLKQKIGAGILFGFLFGVSENFLYLNNIFRLGNFSTFWQRFLWTVPMHIITVLIMVFAGLAGKKVYPAQKFFGAGWIILGLAGAIVLHTLFNGIVAHN